jgi:hypothetical protein
MEWRIHSLWLGGSFQLGVQPLSCPDTKKCELCQSFLHEWTAQDLVPAKVFTCAEIAQGESSDTDGTHALGRPRQVEESPREWVRTSSALGFRWGRSGGNQGVGSIPASPGFQPRIPNRVTRP